MSTYNKEMQKKYREENNELIAKLKKNCELRKKEERAKKQKEWRLKNKENIREYYLKNKERIEEKRKEWRLKNKDKLLEKRREYSLKNKEKILEYIKEYSLQNKERINERRRENYMKKKKGEIAKKKADKIKSMEVIFSQFVNTVRTKGLEFDNKDDRHYVARTIPYLLEDIEDFSYEGCDEDTILKHKSLKKDIYDMLKGENK